MGGVHHFVTDTYIIINRWNMENIMLTQVPLILVYLFVQFLSTFLYFRC